MKRDIHLQIYPSPSKINLGLEILSKRPDGYHEINTIFYRIWEPHDVITVHNSDAFVLTASDPSLKTDHSNLIHKAARAYSDAAQAPDLPNFHFHLDKHIPMGAGLGGGSSNAAMTLLILNGASSNPFSDERLMEIGAKLGADVPFFLSQSSAAVASGIGDQLSPLPLQLPIFIVVVMPNGVSVSTQEAYGNLKLVHRTKNDLLQIIDGDLNNLPTTLRNDFEPTVFARHPVLRAIKEQLYAEGAFYASMSGSGAALFGLFEMEEDAKAAQYVMLKAGHSVFLNEPVNAQA